jgi:hypothetical protein
MQHWFKAIGIAAVLALASSATQAATATCGSGDRIVTLTTSVAATCALASGGNIEGNVLQDEFMQANAAYVLLDKSDSTGGAEEGSLTGSPSLTSGLSGTFSFSIVSGNAYSSFALGFKFGGNPNQLLTTFVFYLPSGVTSGDWSFSGRNDLSHANLYGVPKPDVPPVPLPAAGWLLIAGLGGLAALRHARKA